MILQDRIITKKRGRKKIKMDPFPASTDLQKIQTNPNEDLNKERGREEARPPVQPEARPCWLATTSASHDRAGVGDSRREAAHGNHGGVRPSTTRRQGGGGPM
jgi:hypothetical protein